MTKSGDPDDSLPGLWSLILTLSPFQRMTLLAQSSPSCVIRTLTVPDCRADTALSVTALLIATAALSTPRLPPDEPPTTKTANVATAARATAAAEKPAR